MLIFFIVFSSNPQHLKHNVVNSFSPIFLSADSTNLRCLVELLFSSNLIPRTAINILIDSPFDTRMIFFRRSLRGLPISAADDVYFPCLS